MSKDLVENKADPASVPMKPDEKSQDAQEVQEEYKSVSQRISERESSIVFQKTRNIRGAHYDYTEHEFET